MEMKNLEYIQLHIGYTFENRGLLCQAFTRKSYTEENKNALHNEVLEFYGDKALDFIIMKKERLLWKRNWSMTFTTVPNSAPC